MRRLILATLEALLAHREPVCDHDAADEAEGAADADVDQLPKPVVREHDEVDRANVQVEAGAPEMRGQDGCCTEQLPLHVPAPSVPLWLAVYDGDRERENYVVDREEVVEGLEGDLEDVYDAQHRGGEQRQRDAEAEHLQAAVVLLDVGPHLEALVPHHVCARGRCLTSGILPCAHGRLLDRRVGGGLAHGLGDGRLGGGVLGSGTEDLLGHGGRRHRSSQSWAAGKMWIRVATSGLYT
mmetsp:Transcript_106016/g.285165  ORF Transcript_106016/g.285165 Transcript_106016/m.285165 type:complete len:239 (+) Transcript_106016:157-873(+)